MKLVYISILAAALAGPALSKEIFEGPYYGKVVRVIDGDTFEAAVEIWPTISSTVSVRIRGIDAPEITQSSCDNEKYLGTLAKSALEEEIPPDTDIRLENVEAGSFAKRVIADAFRRNVERGTPLDRQMLRTSYVAIWEKGDPDIDFCSPEWNKLRNDQ
ncbi:thermonuclease family protein [Vannielia sp. SX4]|uniref:thermonuclease family protein n=1 Tax=Vannielia sp. SX4 TaxID=3463852 RepID=UPI00405803CB